MDPRVQIASQQEYGYLFREVPERKARFSHLTEGLSKGQRIQLEILMENFRQQAPQLAESSLITNVGAYTTKLLSLYRRVFPGLILNELGSTQPIQVPDGKAFFWNILYGTAKGAIKVGDRVDQVHDTTYSDRTVELSGPAEMNFDLASISISAKAKALKASMSIEAMQDVVAYHPEVDPEAEMMAAQGDQIRRELDMKGIDTILLGALGGNVNWNISPPAGSGYGVYLDPDIYNRTLYKAMVDCNNLIYKQIYQNATWAIADADTCTRLEKLERFKLDDMADAMKHIAAIHRFGNLAGRWTVYKHPWFAANTILMGWNGNGWLQNAFVWSPYTLYTTPPFQDPDTLRWVRGMMSRDAMTVTRGEAFATVTLIGS